MASVETTSAGISSATAAATSDLPLAVGPNRPMTSTALGRGERELRAGEGRRRRARDGDRDELAGSRVAAEVDRGVPSRPSTQKLRLGPAGPFDENLLDHPDASGVPFCGDALHDLDQPLDALALQLVRDMARHRGRLGARARRVDEREGAVVADLLHDLERLTEVVVRLAGEADDDVGRDCEVRDRCPQLRHQPQVALARVRSPHRLEHPARAGLERQMRVLADRGALRHRSDDVAAEVLRMRAREADALDTGDRVDRPQKLRKARADVAAVRVDVLAEKRHLADALGSEPFDLFEDFARTPGGLSPPDGRHDAVGADRVAAHRDLHPGLEAPLAPNGKLGRKCALLAGAERAASDALAAGAEPIAEVRDRAGPERDIHVGVELEQPVPLRLRIAAADGDDRPRPLALQLRRIAHVGGEARVGLLADRAGVEDDYVRLAL